ncbi:MAG: YbaB/EbfC family nucleoid-associated protein [Saprospiraceae bacterium]|nr:YbaB/EbfC family nucleoid-associated protein [Saprospiraceae bacterium]
MLESLFGNMEERQAEMKAKLAAVIVEAEAGDGAVRVNANGLRQITNLKIDLEKIDMEDSEQLEDLLLVAINRAIDMAADKEAEEAENMVKGIMPPGLDGLSGLFG